MKISLARIIFLCLAVMLRAGMPEAFAQSYTIDWFKIAGGSGTSTGGVFSVSGTISQPYAGAMSGGDK
jgi:hypothetical protein